MLFDVKHIQFDAVNSSVCKTKDITLELLRLDRIHPVVSGNKLFKLHYFLDAAMRSAHKTILTFGGAYSNHLVATAFACNVSGLKSIGIVRGEQPGTLSHTLQNCLDYGMKLQFISREDYKNSGESAFINNLKSIYGDFILVPEGGYAPEGAAGASHIMDLLEHKEATHICTAIGTATTLAGLLLKSKASQQIIAIPVLKNMQDIEDRLLFLTNKVYANLHIFEDYHFGGYTKKNEELIHFMNEFYAQYDIPTDFIYTAKMMYAVLDKINADFFSPGSTIICVHTGGLQGNLSLPKDTLIY